MIACRTIISGPPSGRSCGWPRLQASSRARSTKPWEKLRLDRFWAERRVPIHLSPSSHGPQMSPWAKCLGTALMFTMIVRALLGLPGGIWQIVTRRRDAAVPLDQAHTSRDDRRRIGVAERRYDRWRLRYGGLLRDRTWRLKAPGHEHSQLMPAAAGLTPEKLSLEDETGPGRQWCRQCPSIAEGNREAPSAATMRTTYPAKVPDS